MTPKESIIFHFSIKKYGDNLYKISYYPDKNKKNNKDYCSVKYKPLPRWESSLSRSRSKIFEYAYCNDFDYFVTLTLDPKKRDSKDLKTYMKSLSRFIRYYREKFNCNIQYLLIPEKHKSGSWHMHGLFKNIPDQCISLNQYHYLDWLDYHNKFGFISLSKVRDRDRVSKYITKYITKTFDSSEFSKGDKLYYCSRGLKQAEFLLDQLVQDYNLLSKEFNDELLDVNNDYIKIKYVDKETYYSKYHHLVELSKPNYTDQEKEYYLSQINDKDNTTKSEKTEPSKHEPVSQISEQTSLTFA